MDTNKKIVHTATINTGVGFTITTPYTVEARQRAIFRAFDFGSTIAAVAAKWNLSTKEARAFRKAWKAG